MPALRAIRRKMIELDPALGQIETPASITATTVVIARMGQGTTNDVGQQWTGKWIARGDTATVADFARFIKSATFAAGTGTTLTHDGTNAGDTTATGEIVELIEVGTPWDLNAAINVAVGKVRHETRLILPGYRGGRYYFGADSGFATFVKEPSHVRAVTIRNSAWLTQNDEFEQWHTRGSAGGLTPPDGWVLAGAAGTIARSTTGARKGLYSAAITRAGTDVTLTQTSGLLSTGVTDDNVQSETVSYLFAGTA